MPAERQFHEHVQGFMDLLDDDEKEEFAPFGEALLEKRGYTRSTQWVPPRPSPGGGKPAAGGGGQRQGGGYFKK